jgi:hypothetical protein
MRTTVRLPDELYEQVRRRAVDEGRTVTSFLEEALRRALAEYRGPEPFVVKPFEGTGTLPGVDLHDNSALLDVMEG